MVLKHIVEQHAEEAAFLWEQRRIALRASHYVLAELAELEERIEAHLAGLRVDLQTAKQLSLARLAEPDEGDMFVAAVLALTSFDETLLAQVVDLVDTPQAFHAGLVGGMGWLSSAALQRWLPNMLAADQPTYRYLGIAGAALQRVDIGAALLSAINDPNPLVKARALRAAGELRRKDCLSSLRAYWEAEELDVRFWACWSSLWLGDQAATDHIDSFMVAPSKYQARALQALQVMEAGHSQRWLRDASQTPSQLYAVVQGIGMLGDAVYLPTLVRLMEQPALARIAGESFSQITGLDLNTEAFAGTAPTGFEVGPNDDPLDAEIEMDADEELAWPNLAAVQRWWSDHHGRFVAGSRYLMGEVISQQQCLHVLRVAPQRRRIAAAYTLAVLQPDAPLFATSALVKQQFAQLATN